MNISATVRAFSKFQTNQDSVRHRTSRRATHRGPPSVVTSVDVQLPYEKGWYNLQGSMILALTSKKPKTSRNSKWFNGQVKQNAHGSFQLFLSMEFKSSTSHETFFFIFSSPFESETVKFETEAGLKMPVFTVCARVCILVGSFSNKRSRNVVQATWSILSEKNQTRLLVSGRSPECSDCLLRFIEQQ